MAAGEKRGLTEGERAMAAEAFGEAIPFARVTIWAGHGGNPAAMLAFRNGNPAITLRRTIYFRDRYADFAHAAERAKTLFVHEMTHVWQYRRIGIVRFGLRYARDLVRAGLRPTRMYRYRADEAFFAAMLEAQAEMVADYGAARRAGNAAKMAAIGRSLAGTGIYGL